MPSSSLRQIQDNDNKQMNVIGTVLLILLLTLISGWGDSQGFLHASMIWHKGKLVLPELAKSALGFGVGIISYWAVIRFLQQFGVVSPEVQTIGWFAVTIIGLAIATGQFLKWQTVDQLVAVLVILGVGWLLLRVGG